jgi:succinate-semialdehyde dehydrogenase/glutarate-semialdehyde dehydrogenase
MLMTTERTIPAALFIGGAWVEPTNGGRLDVRNPADGSLVGSVGYGGKAEALAAVEAAQAAFPAWAALPARARADLLLRIAALLQERAERIGYLLALETGKRLPEAVGEIRFGAEYFRWFAEQARRPEGERFPHEAPGRRHFSMARPCGVALCLTPWLHRCRPRLGESPAGSDRALPLSGGSRSTRWRGKSDCWPCW